MKYKTMRRRDDETRRLKTSSLWLLILSLSHGLMVSASFAQTVPLRNPAISGTGHVVSGATLYIDSGASIINQGTATGFGGLTTATTVTGITSGYALYNNAGVLGGLNLAALYQPLDSDLTSIAALSTTSYGRGLLTSASDEALSLSLTGVYNVKTYGAAGDARSVSDAVTNTATNSGGSTTVTSATAAFTTADTGKVAWVVSSVANGRVASVPVGTATYVNSTTITINQLAGFSDSGQLLVLGTDDTAGIQAAVAAAQTAKRARVILPAGGYIITAPIATLTSTQYVSITGDGSLYHDDSRGGTVLFMAPTYTEGPVIENGRDHRDFAIYGGNFDFADGSANPQVMRNGVNLNNVRISVYGYSVQFYSSSAAQNYVACESENASSFGFYLANSANLVNCYMGNNAAYSIGVVNTTAVNIVNCVIDESTTNGLYVSNSTNVNVTATTIYGATGNYGAVLVSSAAVHFTDCLISKYGGNTNSGGLDVQSGTTAWISGCTFEGTGTRYGLNVAGTAYDGGNNVNVTAMNGSWTYGGLATVPIAQGGTGATTLNNLITLGTHTTGNYAATVTGTANEITSSVETGEGAATVLSLPATIDLGGKTSFEIPNGAAPTVDATGEIALDTTITDFKAAPVFFDGTDERVVVSMKKTALNATDNYVIDYDAGTDEFVMSAASGGVPTTITVADTTDSTSFVALFESATGDLGPKTDAGITYNATAASLDMPSGSTIRTHNIAVDTTNYERGSLRWSGNAFIVGSENGGTGVARDTYFQAAGDVYLRPNAGTAMSLTNSAVTCYRQLVPGVDLTSYNLGTASLRWAQIASGGVITNLRNKTTTYTADAQDHTITCDATGGTFTVTLPAAASHTGRIYVIKKTTAANTVTIDANASETIDGATTVDLTTQYSGKVIQCDGTNWHIIGSF